MSDSNYKKIYSGNIFITQQIKQSLNEIGIEPIVKDNTESGRLAGFGTPSIGIQEVFVHENEYEKSLEIIKSIIE